MGNGKFGRTVRKAVERSKAASSASKAAPRKKNKSLASKAHNLGKKAGKAGALLGSAGTAGVIKAVTGRHKGGKKRVKRAAQHMAAGTEAKGRKVKSVLKRAKVRKAAGEDAFRGKYGKLGNKIASKPAATRATPGAKNPAQKPVRKAAGPRNGRVRRTGVRK